MATPKLSVEDQLRQLGQARKLVLGDPNYYSQIVQGILPILGPAQPVELRRWGADFLAESFATPALRNTEKEALSIMVLETMRGMLDNEEEDVFVLRSAVMASASVYPLVLRWIINNSYDQPTWERISAIKARILHLWDSSPTSLKICCIKFVQRVVLAQTVSSGPEQRHNVLDVSLGMIPPNHPLLDPRHLEAEATGLLDRMLGVLQESDSNALLVDATLTTLSIIVRTRPATSNRIVNAILNFNPLKLANSPMTPRIKVLVKSMEKTARMLLIHLSKRDPSNPLTPRMHQYIERMMRSRSEIFDEGASRKRALADHAAGLSSDPKRQRVGTEIQTNSELHIKPLGPGPHSLAQIFMLTSDRGLQGFDATLIPADMATKISIATLSRIDPQLLEQAVSGVRERITSVSASIPPAEVNPNTAPLDVEDDDDDYEPDPYAAEDTEQILNKLDSAPPDADVDPSGTGAPTTLASLSALSPFKLAPPPVLDPELASQVGQVAVARVFGPLASLEDVAAARRSRAGMNRLAASSYDRESWLTLVTRLATRATAGLDGAKNAVAVGEDNSAIVSTTVSSRLNLSEAIRETLYRYVMEDFRRRIDTAVSWLCEEWYNDKLAGSDAQLHYEKWTLRLVDGFFDYLTPQDKVLTRFLSEIPELSRAVLERVKTLCRDPSMVALALTSLLYLVMMRPPVRDAALDTVEGIWLDFEEARPLASKYLVKWRPRFIESQTLAREPAPPNETSANVAVAS